LGLSKGSQTVPAHASGKGEKKMKQQLDCTACTAGGTLKVPHILNMLHTLCFFLFKMPFVL